MHLPHHLLSVSVFNLPVPSSLLALLSISSLLILPLFSPPPCLPNVILIMEKVRVQPDSMN